MIEWRNASSRGRPGAEFGEAPVLRLRGDRLLGGAVLGSELGNQETREGLFEDGMELRLSSQTTRI